MLRRCDSLTNTLMLVGIIAGFALAPRAASASCGDYLVTAGHSASANTHGAMPTANVHSKDSRSSTAPAQQPCHGPNCRKSAPPRSPNPAPVRQGSHDQFAVVMGGADCHAIQQTWNSFELAYTNSQWSAENIFHPPR
jgi:hypothetical protein